MLREGTDEVSRLAMRFALIHPVVVEWYSSEVILSGCVNVCFSDENVACPDASWPSKTSG